MDLAQHPDSRYSVAIVEEDHSLTRISKPSLTIQHAVRLAERTATHNSTVAILNSNGTLHRFIEA
jgi:hypothetical protein